MNVRLSNYRRAGYATAHRAWQGCKFVGFFFLESKVGLPLMGDAADIGVRTSLNTTFKLNQNMSAKQTFYTCIHLNMYTTTFKQQERSTCKYFHPKCSTTTNFTARLLREALNHSEVLRACFRLFSLCFHLKFYTSFKPILYRNIFTKYKF